jgi:Protein of unknown function (DUF4240)
MRHFKVFFLLVWTLFACGQTTDKTKSLTSKTQIPVTEFKKGDKMDKQEFWKIISFSFDKAQQDKSLQEKVILEKLLTYSTDDIIQFEIIFRQLVIEADDFKVMAAEKIIKGWVTDDPYLYFRCWLIGQGEKTFTETLKNPDYLADLVDKQTSTNFEQLMYIATEAFEQKTGKKEDDDKNDSFPRNFAIKTGLVYDFGAPPTKGADWTTEQLPKLYPKLWAKFN